MDLLFWKQAKLKYLLLEVIYHKVVLDLFLATFFFVCLFFVPLLLFCFEHLAGAALWS